MMGCRGLKMFNCYFHVDLQALCIFSVSEIEVRGKAAHPYIIVPLLNLHVNNLHYCTFSEEWNISTAFQGEAGKTWAPGFGSISFTPLRHWWLPYSHTAKQHYSFSLALYGHREAMLLCCSMLNVCVCVFFPLLIASISLMWLNAGSVTQHRGSDHPSRAASGPELTGTSFC